jgi:hypothetical protein
MTDAPEETGKIQKGSRWPRGKSGNPNGRPRGSRSHVLAALDQIGEENAEAIVQKAVEQAKNGDQRAIELILSRVWPARKGRPVVLDLPQISAPGDLVAALAAVAQGVASGMLTPDEGHAVAAILETQRKAVETLNLEARIAALERSREAPR